MSRNLEELIGNVWMDGCVESLDGQDGFISKEEYNQAINSGYMIM